MIAEPGGLIQIAGAGPTGLAAAITLARAGRKVIVHEAHQEVGSRFGGDLQGLENWTVEQDVLSELDALGLDSTFEKVACRQCVAFDPSGRAYAVRSKAPVFYLVERGPRPGSLDSALLARALALGVSVRFGSRVTRLDAPAVFAAGPKQGDVIAAGYHFDTAMPDGFWVICDDALAPQGYAYLLVMSGKGTVKSCMFSGFESARMYAERTVAAFQRLVGLDMRDPKPHGGVGTFRVPESACSDSGPVAGEEAGFQDALWGFGMRLAIRSGVLAARALLAGEDYDTLWRRELRPWLRASHVNRALYGALGNRGYPWLLRCVASTDAREFLRRRYALSWPKRALEPWAQASNGRGWPATGSAVRPSSRAAEKKST